MSLLKEERIELVLLGFEGWSYRKRANVFIHVTQWALVGFPTVWKMVRKFNVELIHQVHVNLAK